RLDDPNNPNWKNAIGKYLTLRPRPQDNPGFPYPEDRGGDVRSLPWGLGFLGQGGNDSIWIDFGAPVLVAANGRKYKMLFAPLIIDLDGRINLNVHGNIKNGGKTYAGNQGLGRWEVDLNRVIPVPAEVVQLFSGRTNPTVAGRYNADAGPHIPATPPQFKTQADYIRSLLVPPVGPWYAQVDFDGLNASGLLSVPAAPKKATDPITAFPNFPKVVAQPGYDNSSDSELTNPLHPALFNYYSPLSPDRTFSITNMEALLRYGEKGSPAFSP